MVNKLDAATATGSGHQPCRFTVAQPALSVDGTCTPHDLELVFLQGEHRAAATKEEQLAASLIRRVLDDNQLRYQVLYGSLDEQQDAIVRQVSWCLAKIQREVAASPQRQATGMDANFAGTRLKWAHTCENCGDSASERILLSRLISERNCRA